MEKDKCVIRFGTGAIGGRYIDLVWFGQSFRIWFEDTKITCIQYTLGFVHWEWSGVCQELEDIWIGYGWGCCKYEVSL